MAPRGGACWMSAGWRRQSLALAALVVTLSGCMSLPYRQTAAARFTGALDVRWVAADQFLFMPNPDEPLTLLRRAAAPIRPGPMLTDGGSIPRFLWGVKGFSPWGYAPAYIVHDWVFQAHHCGVQPDGALSFEDSVAVMAESLKAVMEASPEVRNDFVFESVVNSVASPIARRLWERGTCRLPRAAPLALPRAAPPVAAGAPTPGAVGAPRTDPRPAPHTDEAGPPGELLMTIRFQ